MRIEGYEARPLAAGESMLSRPGFWAHHLLGICGGWDGGERPEPEWFGADGADVDALADTLLDPGRWPVFRVTASNGAPRGRPLGDRRPHDTGEKPQLLAALAVRATQPPPNGELHAGSCHALLVSRASRNSAVLAAESCGAPTAERAAPTRAGASSGTSGSARRGRRSRSRAAGSCTPSAVGPGSSARASRSCHVSPAPDTSASQPVMRRAASR